MSMSTSSKRTLLSQVIADLPLSHEGTELLKGDAAVLGDDGYSVHRLEGFDEHLDYHLAVLHHEDVALGRVDSRAARPALDLSDTARAVQQLHLAADVCHGVLSLLQLRLLSLLQSPVPEVQVPALLDVLFSQPLLVGQGLRASAVAEVFLFHRGWH